MNTEKILLPCVGRAGDIVKPGRRFFERSRVPRTYGIEPTNYFVGTSTQLLEELAAIYLRVGTEATKGA